MLDCSGTQTVCAATVKFLPADTHLVVQWNLLPTSTAGTYALPDWARVSPYYPYYASGFVIGVDTPMPQMTASAIRYCPY